MANHMKSGSLILESILNARRKVLEKGYSPDVVSLSWLDVRRLWRWQASYSFGLSYMPGSFREFLEQLQQRKLRVFGMRVEARPGLSKPMASVGELTYEI